MHQIVYSLSKIIFYRYKSSGNFHRILFPMLYPFYSLYTKIITKLLEFKNHLLTKTFLQKDKRHTKAFSEWHLTNSLII